MYVGVGAGVKVAILVAVVVVSDSAVVVVVVVVWVVVVEVCGITFVVVEVEVKVNVVKGIERQLQALEIAEDANAWRYAGRVADAVIAGAASRLASVTVCVAWSVMTVTVLEMSVSVET